MFYILLFLSILKFSLFKEEKKNFEGFESTDFPPNEYFNKIEKNKNYIYIGNQLSYLKFNDSIDDYIKDNNFFFDVKEKYLIIDDNSSIYCDENNEFNKKKTLPICIENESIVSFGEIIFIKYEIISYFSLFFGFFVLLYGTGYYIFGLIFHCTFFIYFFIKDFVEFFCHFSNLKIPLFLFTGALITGILISIFFKQNENDKIVKMIYGAVTGYFLFKSIFYYIIIYFELNVKALFIICLFVFIILGVVGSLFVKENLNKQFLIICNSLNGSFYIVKSIAYIVGGYYSDIIATRKDITFEKKAKEKIVLYMFIEIILSVSSFFFQIKYIKYIENKSNMNSNDISKNRSPRSSFTNDVTKLTTKGDLTNDSANITMNNNTTMFNATNINNHSNTSEGDQSNIIYDQEE